MLDTLEWAVSAADALFKYCTSELAESVDEAVVVKEARGAPPSASARSATGTQSYVPTGEMLMRSLDTRPEMQFQTRDGVRLAHVDVGSDVPGQPPLVLICVFQIIVGTDFAGSWAVISQHRGHPF